MYEAWKQDPSSVHASWNAYFRNIDAGASPGQAFSAPPALGGAAPAIGARPSGATAASAAEAGSMLNVVALTRAFQVRGHEQATLDPLGLQERKYVPELDPATYGFSEADLDKPVGPLPPGLLATPVPADTPLRDLIARLKTLYCGHVGIEYMHIQSREKCDWIRERVEGLTAPFDKEGKKQIYDRLTHAHTFESFMAGKYSTTKRFGLEGCESLIPGLKALIDAATERGVENVVLGMPHRGRLNVLANVIRKPLEMLFKEFQGEDTVASGSGEELGDFSVAGDVKYHLGTSYDRTYPDGRKVHLSLMANPSHLEAVNPVVVGKAYAKQFFDKDPEGHRTMPLLMHGDAAFAGQGVVYETMHFANLENYRTGGTVHVVVNNQIGFTTDPVEARSSAYSSDVGKAFNCPILHVNADHPEAVTRVFQLAAEWRQTFHEDVIVDLIGYRRSGHNEMDQPSFTQPVMYGVIAKHPPVLDLYTGALEKEGVLPAEDLTKIRDTVNAVHETAFENSKSFTGKHDWLDSRWTGYKGPGQMSRIRETGVDQDLLHKVGTALSTIPDDFKPHRMIKKIYDLKKKSVDDGEGIDWGTAEAMAWGTLLGEDNHVRISGQDVERGTFSHRHAVLHDQRDNTLYTPLNNLARLGALPKQAEFVATNSPLSEFGTLGFETGYALESPNQLVLWEAQFGDFVNGAQVMIDQFISSGEDKWLRQLGLVMLLPHGYDGQGAEHSSCRIERFLQCSNEDPDVVPPLDESHTMQIQRTNWQVCNITEPGNYFHALRRQLHREFRKPLIVASPKNLLRHKMATSTLDSMATGTKFRRVIGEAVPEEINAPDKVQKLVLCSGKIYYELLTARRAAENKDVALVRVEQLSPFPFDLVAREMATYENADVVWCQEEPQNMGYWAHVAPRIETAAESINNDSRRPSFVGRHASAAPAVGYAARHKQEQDAILHEVFA